MDPFEANVVDSSLSEQLISGEIDPEQFLNEIAAAEESDLSRTKAGENLEMLNSAQVRDFLQPFPELAAQYENQRSIAAFHVAQQRLIENDLADALPFLTQALEAAQAVAWSGLYDGWRNYIAGTIAYTNGDQAALEAICPTLAYDPDYLPIIMRMNESLKNGQPIDYNRDYNV